MKVEIPEKNHTIEFPDDMSQEEIRKVILANWDKIPMGQKPAERGIVSAGMEGLRGSASGLVLGARPTAGYQPEGYMERLAQGVGTGVGDLPFMIAGALGGAAAGTAVAPGPGTIIGGGMMGFGLPTAVKGAYLAKSPGEAMLDTTESMITGGLTAGTGAAAKMILPAATSKLGKLAVGAGQVAPELGAMEFSGAMMEGRPMSMQSVADNAGVLAAFKIAGRGVRSLRGEKPPPGGGGSGPTDAIKTALEKELGVKLEEPTSKTHTGSPADREIWPKKTLSELIEERYGKSALSIEDTAEGVKKTEHPTGSARVSALAIEEALARTERQAVLDRLTKTSGKSAAEAARILDDPAERAKYEINKIIEEERRRILGKEIDTLRKGAVNRNSTIDEILELSDALKKTSEAKRSALGIKEYGDIPIVGEEKTTGRPLVSITDETGSRKIIPVEGGTIREIIHLEKSQPERMAERVALAMEKQAKGLPLTAFEMLALRKQYKPPEIKGDRIGPIIKVRDEERAEFKNAVETDTQLVNDMDPNGRSNPPKSTPPSDPLSSSAGRAGSTSPPTGARQAYLDGLLAKAKAAGDAGRINIGQLSTEDQQYLVSKGGVFDVDRMGNPRLGYSMDKKTEDLRNKVGEKKKPEGTLITWIRDKGGIKDPDYSGEFSLKETGVIGLWNRAGRGIDEMLDQAKAEGRVGHLTTEKEFVELILRDAKASKGEGKRAFSLEKQENIGEAADPLAPISKKEIATYGLTPDQVTKLNKIRKEDPEAFLTIMKGNVATQVRDYEMKRKGKAEKMTQEPMLREGVLHDEGGTPLFDFFGAVRHGLGQAKRQVIDPILNLTTAEGDTLRHQFVRKVQDRHTVLKRLEDAISAKYGRLDDSLSAYRKEELMSGKVRRTLDMIDNVLFKPFTAKLAEARGSGVTLQDLELYSTAKHAPEFNKTIRDRNQKFLTGELTPFMDDATAAKIVADFQRSGKAAVLDQLHKDIVNINRMDWDLRKKYGLITDEVYNTKKGEWHDYVPFRGGEQFKSAANTGVGLSVRRGFYGAKGRMSSPDSPILNSLAQLEETIIRGEKNTVGNVFLNFARQGLAKGWLSPDDIRINSSSEQGRYNPKTGQVEYKKVADFMGDKETRDSVFYTLENGKLRYITIDDNPLLVRSLTNLGVQRGAKLVQSMAMFNRYLAMVKTSLNLEFAVTNPIKDAMTATLNLTAEQSAGMARQILRDVPRAMVGAYRGFKFELGTEWGRYADEYRQAGGAVGFYSMKDLESRGNALRREVNAAQGKPLAVFGKALVDGLGVIGDLTAAGENGMRLSAFVNARKMGFSTDQAASLAKNLTVNFNRSGEWGPMINAAYMFANANIQGTARMIEVAQKAPDRFKYLALGGIGFGLAAANLNRAVMGEDKDGIALWDKIDNVTKNKNLIVPTPWDRKDPYIKIPLGYGWNVFHALGNTIDGVASNPRMTVGKGALDLGGALAEAFNPIGNAANVLSMFSPTVGDPLVELVTNRNWAGSPIMPDQPQFGAPKPYSERYWESVTGASKAAARGLNSLTGGNKAKSGVIDLSPEWIDYMTSYFLGGAGDVLRRAVDVVEKMYTGQKVAVKDIPVARRFVGEKSEYFDSQLFRENLSKAQADLAELKMYGKVGGPDLSPFAAEGMAYQQQFGKLGHTLDTMDLKGDPDILKKREKIKALEGAEKMAFNKKVEQYLAKKRAGADRKPPEVRY